ncbi:MAG: hypothetical protein J6M60_01330 [Clostridia bacterium]|nr:hypothetical protein [Clostridia bacterium]
MIQKRTKVSEFSTSELIQMARQAIKSNTTDEINFKRIFGVKFNFSHVCNSLHKRKFLGRRIMTSEEVKKAKECKCNKYLSEMFIEIKERYEDWLLEAHDNGKT